MLTVAQLPGLAPSDIFPADGDLKKQLAYIVRYAEYAPEIFGSKPWRLAIVEDGIEIYCEADQRLRKADYDGRESAIATGSAIYLLRLALRCHLLEPEIRHLHTLKQPSLVAKITVKGQAEPTAQELELFALLTGRESESGPLPPLDRLAPDFRWLRTAACEEGATFRYIDDAFLQAMTVSMLQSGDKLVYNNAEECEAFRAWLGVHSAHAASEGEFVTWSVFPSEVGEFSAPDPETADAPIMAVFCTQYDDMKCWLRTGESLAKVHLLACGLGMKLTVFNQPLWVPGMRARFARETGFCNFPQVIIRIGYDLVSTPRPKLREILLNGSATPDPCDCGCDDCGGGDHEGTGRS